MTTQCYAMVRGSSLRITELDKRGGFADAPRFAVSKSVSKVTINEVTDSASSSTLDTPDGEKRLRFMGATQTIRHTVDIEFLRVDPGVLHLIAGVGLVHREALAVALGFDMAGFDTTPFDAAPSEDEPVLEVAGFDSNTRLPATTFALEVWSKLAGQRCDDGLPAYGYTLFPYLAGGRLSGFQFSNGLVSFNLVGAQTRKGSRWGVGPYDLDGPFERLIEPVSRNTSWRTFITSAVPPAEVDGIQSGVVDVIDNGTPVNPMPPPSTLLSVDGGGPVTSAHIIDGGRP